MGRRPATGEGDDGMNESGLRMRSHAGNRAGAVAMLMAMLTGVGEARAQKGFLDGNRASLLQAEVPLQSGEVRLTVPAVILAAPASDSELPISITPEAAIPPASLVRIRGLPPTAALSDGHTIAPGTWAVPITSLKTLRLVLPAGISGKREITISLVTVDGTLIAETRTALVIAAAGLIAPEERKAEPTPAPSPPMAATPVPPVALPPIVTAPVVAPTSAPPPPVVAAPPPPPPTKAAALPQPPVEPAKPAPPAPAPPTAPAAALAPAAPLAPAAQDPQARERAQQLLARGVTVLQTGDIASARLFFERAAEAGLAEAALAMGATYDAGELAKIRAHGIRPDAAEARRWYERAGELGSGDAVQRLKRLGAR